MQRIILSLLTVSLFLWSGQFSEVLAGSGSLSVKVMEQKDGFTQPSYVDSVAVTGPSHAGGIAGIISCDSKDYIGGICVDLVRRGSGKQQIIAITVRNVVNGEYTVAGKRAGYRDASTSFSISDENSAMFGELTIVSVTDTTVPQIQDPGVIYRGTNVNFTVVGFTDSMFLTSRYALEIVDPTGNRYDCQELRRESSSTATASLRTPSDPSISFVILRVYRTNTRDSSTPACEDLSGQSPLNSLTANLTAAPGVKSTLYKYDSATNSCNPDPEGEPLDECKKKIKPTTGTSVKASEPLKCGPGNEGINTALGCIPVGSTNEFVGWFLRWAIGIAGGVAFILMLIAAFQIMTASGNPEKIQGGKELLNAAISGLVLIVFSAFLLKLIGVDILALPGFRK